jgi:predicted MFS family arabinose efflux permease
MYAFYRFSPVFLEARFNFDPPLIGYALSYEALINGLAQIGIVKYLSARFSPKLLTALFSGLLGLFLALFVIPSWPYAIVITIFFIGIALGVAITNASVMISEEVSQEIQGHALGTLIAVHMAGALVISFFGGLLSAVSPDLPLYAGALMAAVCALILFISCGKFSTLKSN